MSFYRYYMVGGTERSNVYECGAKYVCVCVCVIITILGGQENL